jgi:hypothetical protein
MAYAEYALWKIRRRSYSQAQKALCREIKSHDWLCGFSVVLTTFGRTIAALASLQAASMFPLVGAWRLAILEPTIAQVRLTPLVQVLSSNSKSVSSLPSGTLLTLLRLETNDLRGPFKLLIDTIARVSGSEGEREAHARLVPTRLHQDRLVRVAGASFAFNASECVRGRVARIKGEGVGDGIRADEDGGEWEVELVNWVNNTMNRCGCEKKSKDCHDRTCLK